MAKLINLLHLGKPILNKITVLLIKTFKKDGEWDDRHDSKGGKKSRFVWFSKNDLLEIIGIIDSIKEENRDREGDGVRIYLAKYPNRGFGNIKGKDYNNRRTLVFVPTYHLQNKEDIHYDFIDPEEVRNISASIDKADFLFDATGYNHGELCPPNSGCSGANISDVLDEEQQSILHQAGS